MKQYYIITKSQIMNKSYIRWVGNYTEKNEKIFLMKRNGKYTWFIVWKIQHYYDNQFSQLIHRPNSI